MSGRAATAYPGRHPAPWGGAGSPSSFGRQTAGIEPLSSSISCVKSLYSRMDMPPGGLAVWSRRRERGDTRICETVPSAPRGPSDRSRTCVPMVWIDINYTNTHRPTARRRTRPLGLRGAPRGTVGDVPTAEGGEVAVTARCMRARACGELRLTRQYEHDILPLMLAGGELFSTLNHRFSVGQLATTASPTGREGL